MSTVPLVEVFWPVGDAASRVFRGVLLDHGITASWRNIGTDAEAHAVVGAIGDAGETLPVVRIGDRTLVEPSWSELAPLLNRDPREPARPPRRRPYSSPATCMPPPSGP